MKKLKIIVACCLILVFMVGCSGIKLNAETESTVKETEEETEEKTERETEESTTESETEAPTEKVEEPIEKQYISGDDIEKAYTNPDAYKDKYINISGKTFGEIEYDDDFIYFQMFADTENSEKNTVVMAQTSETLNTGDYVTIDGKILGAFEGQNAFGGTITALLVYADSVQKGDYISVISPTLKTVEVNQTQQQYGYAISIEKIEFSPIETRVYITVNNNGSDKFYLYDFNMKIVQDGKQFENQDNWDYDYPELQTSILQGVTTSGVVAFPVMEQDKDIKIYIEAYSDNWQEGINDYIFDIAVQ